MHIWPVTLLAISYEASIIAIKFLHALWQLSVSILTIPISVVVILRLPDMNTLQRLALSSGYKIKFQLVCIICHSSSWHSPGFKLIVCFGCAIGSGQDA